MSAVRSEDERTNKLKGPYDIKTELREEKKINRMTKHSERHLILLYFIFVRTLLPFIQKCFFSDCSYSHTVV